VDGECNPEIWKVASNIVSNSHGWLRRDEPLGMLGHGAQGTLVLKASVLKNFRHGH